MAGREFEKQDQSQEDQPKFSGFAKPQGHDVSHEDVLKKLAEADVEVDRKSVV